MDNNFMHVMVCVTLWLYVNSTDGCVTIEILGNFSINDVIEVEENSDVNLTFYVNTDSCPNNTPADLLKMSMLKKQKMIDQCKILLTRTTCQKSMQDQPCSCLYADKTFVQFYKSFKESDYQVYFWLWPPYKENVGEVTFVIRKPRMETECTKTCNQTVPDADVCLPLIYVIVPSVAVVVVVIVVVAFGCFVRRRCKARNIPNEEVSDQDAQPPELIQELVASQSRRHRQQRRINYIETTANN